jgi:hypothetical protein
MFLYFYFCRFLHSLFLLCSPVYCSLHPLLHNLHLLVPSLCISTSVFLSFFTFIFALLFHLSALPNTVCLLVSVFIIFPIYEIHSISSFLSIFPILFICFFQTLIAVGLSPVRMQQLPQQAQDRHSVRHPPSLYNYTANCRCSQQLQHRTTCECRECVNWRQVTRIKKITCHLERGITCQVQGEQRIP